MTFIPVFSTEKKPKKQKEKPCDVSDGISDLLAQMNLQSSSSVNDKTQPPITTIPATEKTEVVILDTPVNHKPSWKANEENGLGGSSNTPLSDESEAVASPSVSAVIDALHLSDIDWDALSFTSSPSPQTTPNFSAHPKLNKTTDSDVNESQGEDAKAKASSDVRQAAARAAPELCYTECPLRDRVLLRNTARVINQRKADDDMVSKQPSYELAVSSHNTKTNGRICNKGSKDGELPKTEIKTSKQPFTLAEKDQCKGRNKCTDAQKAHQKYKFVRTALLSSVAPPQSHSQPGPNDRNVAQTAKKSVCMSVCSSSEDSDAENQQFGPQKKTKIKPMSFSLKPAFAPKMTKASIKPTKQSEPKPQRHRGNVEINGTHTSSKSTCKEVSPAPVDVFPQSPASPVAVSDSDDSVIGSESPLPLAERLRLKFLK